MPAPSLSAVATLRSLLRWSGRIALVLYFAAAALILAGRYWLMPEIGAWRGQIEQRLSQAIGLRVTLAGLAADWPGLHPRLAIDRLELHDPAGRPALVLERVEAEIGWASLIYLEPRLHRLELAAPVLDIRRDAAGALHVAGLPMRVDGDMRAADWLLEQRRIVVRDARVIWRDELRGAPPLAVERLDFELRNAGRRHSLGLTARPGGGIAERVDLRANLTGRSLADLAAWSGQTYADLARVDLAALATWLDLPLEMKRGRGDARLWLDFAERRPTGFAADLALADFGVRLQPDLPLLAVQGAEGRLAGRKTPEGYSGEVQRLSLTSASGIAIGPIQASLNLVAAQRWQGGELRANHLDLGALAMLAEYLPLPADWRTRLDQFAPRGRLDAFAFAWQGPAAAPEHWRVNGDFAGLALAAQGNLPGFAGISGRIEGDRRGGLIHLDSRAATLDLPAVLPEPTLAFERLEAEIGWRGTPGMTEILFQRVAFANADARGEAAGSWRYTGEGPGDIDLSARLAHAEGKAVWRYMPRAVNPDARAWLRAGLAAGRAENVTLRLKGPLARFPFRGGQGGIFQVRGGIRDARIDYAPGWPGMTGIDGDLLFEGERMLIRGQRATIMGVTLAEVRAAIPDLEMGTEILTVTGRARGETQRFLDFIEASPVGARIDHFTADMTASGSGELDLKLTMPLRHVADTEVQGRYRFADNRLAALPDLPPFTGVQGELSFTAERLQSRNLRARFLDQPLTLEVGTLPGGAVRIAAAGSLEAHALRRFYGVRALEHLSGTTPWRGSLTVKKPTAELRIESDLRGLASSLPDPFNKSALAGWPLVAIGRFEPQRDEWSATLGAAAAVRLQRQAGDGWRGRIALGAAAAAAPPALPLRGVTLAAHVPQLDVDAWRNLLRDGGNAAGPGDALRLAAVDIRARNLSVAHRPFHDVDVQGARSGTRWQLNLAAREAQGQLSWDTAGAGRVSGRFARLHLPDATGTPGDEPAADPDRHMPAVDLTVDSFRLGARALGELRIGAENREGRWQAKLDVENEAARLSGEGRWRPGRAAAETALAFRLDVKDAEKLLHRLAMPDAVRRGEGRIDGDLRWAGSPLDFDAASLSGWIKADFGRGQFKKLEPGVGRLLGVLSLQSLPRRITLDFRDIFSEGFAFDSLVGEAKIGQGVIGTDDLRIRGPAAKVTISGQADLAAETQNLKVRVQPALGETLAVGAMLANPAAGAVAWAAQKILRDPLDQIFAYEYAVTGRWADPKVEKIQAPAAQPEASPP